MIAHDVQLFAHNLELFGEVGRAASDNGLVIEVVQRGKTVPLFRAVPGGQIGKLFARMVFIE